MPRRAPRWGRERAAAGHARARCGWQPHHGGGETRYRRRQPLDQSGGTSTTGTYCYSRQFRNDAPPTVRRFLYPHGRDRPLSRAPDSPTRETGRSTERSGDRGARARPTYCDERSRCQRDRCQRDRCQRDRYPRGHRRCGAWESASKLVDAPGLTEGGCVRRTARRAARSAPRSRRSRACRPRTCRTRREYGGRRPRTPRRFRREPR